MKKLSAAFACVLLSACATSTPKPVRTQLEIREFQTRTFETGKTNEVLSALVEAFQDEGFMVKNVVPEVGLVSAVKESDVEDSAQANLRIFFFGQNAMWSKNSTIEATANVRSHGGRTKVRTTFQEKVMNNRGGVDFIETIENPEYYQMFFDKVGKSIFIEKQKIS